MARSATFGRASGATLRGAIADAAARSGGWERPSVAEYVDGQYAGAKAALRPPEAARLKPGTGPGQATHKLSLRSVREVDDEVLRLLHVAYEQNA
jgi:hypothetical protein